MILVFINILGLITAWSVWLGLVLRPLTPGTHLTLAIGGILIVIPIIFAGRWALDRQPTVHRAVWVTTFVHYLIVLPLGAAIIGATRYAQNQEAWNSTLPGWVGLGIMILSGALLILVVFNLALKGLGAPFAIALTRVVATDWVYAWTRNPMIISSLAFLLGLGLWLKSSLFILWLLIVVTPAILIFLFVYEERELEIRFGKQYLDYKAKTPMFFPGKWFWSTTNIQSNSSTRAKIGPK